jgi:hypothetical protein
VLNASVFAELVHSCLYVFAKIKNKMPEGSSVLRMKEISSVISVMEIHLPLEPQPFANFVTFVRNKPQPAEELYERQSYAIFQARRGPRR